MANIELKYRTFDSLLSSVSSDLRVFSEEGMIEPAWLIKVARRVNYDLGLRIYQTKETIIDIENGYGKLPEDFYVLDFALLLGKYREIIPEDWKGRVTENINVPCEIPTPPTSNCHCWTAIAGLGGAQTKIIYCDSTTASIFIPQGTMEICAISIEQVPNLTLTTDHYCVPTGVLNTWTCDVPATCATCATTSTLLPTNTCTPEEDPFFQRGVYSTCGDNCVKVLDCRRSEVREYEWAAPLYITTQKYLDPGSFNHDFKACGYNGQIKNGYLYTSVKCAKCFIAYQGDLVDEEGNLLVLDHPEIRTYYEDALKEEIFRNLWYSGEEVENKLKYSEERTKQSRLRALSIVNMPNFSEMMDVHMMNRRMQYARYYDTWHTNVMMPRYNSWIPF